MAEPTDAAQIARALSGDSSPFGLLMQRHRREIHRLARRYLGDTAGKPTPVR